MRLRLLFPIVIAVIFLITGIIMQESRDYVFGINMTLIPGLLYPLASINLKGKSWINVLIHLIISDFIFCLASAGYFYNDKTCPVIFLGGLLGSFLFQSLTKYLFKTKTPWKTIFLISLFSLISFVPFQIDSDYYTLGIGIFLWMIINTVIVNNGTTANRR